MCPRQRGHAVSGQTMQLEHSIPPAWLGHREGTPLALADGCSLNSLLVVGGSLADVAIENRGKGDPEIHCPCPKMGSGCSDRLCLLPGCCNSVSLYLMLENFVCSW